MTNTKHTPGPWEVSEKLGGLINITGQRPQGKGPIAVVPIWPEPGVDKANANLIAAAPEMLEALKHPLIAKALSYWCSSSPRFDFDESTSLQNLLSNTIAKAEGRA